MSIINWHKEVLSRTKQIKKISRDSWTCPVSSSWMPGSRLWQSDSLHHAHFPPVRSTLRSGRNPLTTFKGCKGRYEWRNLPSHLLRSAVKLKEEVVRACNDPKEKYSGSAVRKSVMAFWVDGQRGPPLAKPGEEHHIYPPDIPPGTTFTPATNPLLRAIAAGPLEYIERRFKAPFRESMIWELDTHVAQQVTTRPRRP